MHEMKWVVFTQPKAVVLQSGAIFAWIEETYQNPQKMSWWAGCTVKMTLRMDTVRADEGHISAKSKADLTGEITAAEKFHHETVVRGVQNIGIDFLIDDLSSVDSKGLNYPNVRDDLEPELTTRVAWLKTARLSTAWWQLAVIFGFASSRQDTGDDVPVVTRRAAAAQHRRTQQHNHHKQEQRTEQAMQEGERDQREEMGNVRKNEKGVREERRRKEWKLRKKGTKRSRGTWRVGQW